MKPVVVYDPLTGNGWYQDEVTGSRYYYDRSGRLARTILAAAPPPPPPPKFRLTLRRATPNSSRPSLASKPSSVTQKPPSGHASPARTPPRVGSSICEEP